MKNKLYVWLAEQGGMCGSDKAVVIAENENNAMVKILKRDKDHPWYFTKVGVATLTEERIICYSQYVY